MHSNEFLPFAGTQSPRREGRSGNYLPPLRRRDLSAPAMTCAMSL
jgi:hypothetical protein